MPLATSRALRVCAFGTFDRGFDRSWILLEALEQSGATVEYCHFDLWTTERHKTHLFPWRWMLLLARYIRGLMTLSIAFLKTRPCDVLYVGYMGQVDLLVAYCLNWRRRSTLVFDPCISLFNTLVDDRGLVKAHGLFAMIVRALDRAACRLADVVLLDTSAHGQYFEDTLGVAKDKIHRVFVGAAPDFQRASWSPDEGPFTVLFYAKFSPLHGIPAILDAAKRLRDEDVRFTIVGGGQLEDAVEAIANSAEATNIEWIRWLERDGLIERLRGCHLALGVFGTTTKAAMVIPNKVFQAIAMGVPVITRDGLAIRELLDANDSAILCSAGDGEALARAILEWKRNMPALQAVGRRGREAFLARASHAAIARQFMEAVVAP